MMHFRKRDLIADKKQAKCFDKKYSKWRKGSGRTKRFKKYSKTQLLSNNNGKKKIKLVINWQDQ